MRAAWRRVLWVVLAVAVTVCAVSLAGPSRSPVRLAMLNLPEELVRLIPQAVTAATWPPAAGTTLLVSALGGVAANDYCGDPAVSANGQYVAFRTDATNLGSGTAGYQVYRKNMVTGAVDLVTAVGGTAGKADGYSPSISADGRYVAFVTEGDLVTGSGLGFYCYRRDMNSTDASSVIRLDRSDSGTTGDRTNGRVSLSGDGNRAAFTSADPLTPAATNLYPQVFVRDVSAGHTYLSSTDGGGNESDDWCYMPRISSDGNYVTFQTAGTNLPGHNGSTQIYRAHATTGVAELVSCSSGGAAGNGTSQAAVVSGDGSCVAFYSQATNLVSPAPTINGFYMKNMTTGAVVWAGKRLGSPPFPLWFTAIGISGNGRYVAFPWSDLEAYVCDTTTGAVSLASRSTARVVSTGDTIAATISADGTCVVFSSTTADLVSPPLAAPYSNVSQIWLNAPEFVAGDVNSDGVVNRLDLAEMIREWRTQTHDPYVSHAGATGNWINADVNGDGKLTRLDVDLLMQNTLPWGM